MTQRTLYLAAYDITEADRLRKALHVLRDYATGGQKSVFECYLTEPEKAELKHRIATLIEPAEDRFLLIRLSQRARTRTLGIGRPPADPAYYYIG